jgi:class 3 adenylate cyclase/tetratricopeptide (TPR) repeat protein
VTDLGTSSAESRLRRLLARLLTAAEASLASGDLEPARSTAEEVLAVDPENPRAAAVLQQVSARQRGPSGERALMTLLFSDLVGSTLLSELVEPEELRDLFAFYRQAAREAITRYGGEVMKFMGDGVLAGFGFPEPHEDDARRAVLAGLDLVTAVRGSRDEFEHRLGVAPEVRIGIHTGQVVVTDLSSDPSSDGGDSIVGVAPNLAARIQQAAQPGQVVISDVTHQLVDVDFHLHSLGERELKGISRLVEIFAVDRPRYGGTRFEAERFRTVPLVGRDTPRDRLATAWDVVRSGLPAPGHENPTGATVLVTGEPGIGKTRLVAELVDRVEETEGRVIAAGCLPYYSNVALWPVARLMERALGLRDDADRVTLLAEHLSGLGLDPARTLPFVGSLVDATDPVRFPTPELDPTAFLDETLHQLVTWLGALGRQDPLLFVVEDLHWADPSTIAFLGRVAEAQPLGVLTVATTREPELVPWAAASDMVVLGRLHHDEAARMVGSLTDGKALTDAQRQRIVAQGEGIPLFVEELTRSFLSQDRAEPIPLRLHELLAWRLKAPGVVPRVAQVAATVGPAFDAATVAAVVGDPAVVEHQLGVLVDEGIIEASEIPDVYRFQHALMRDAAYETQTLDVRRSTHAAVADTIAAQGGEAALVAEHLDLAGEAARAAQTYLLAAQAEQTRGAHTESTKLLSRATELLDTLPESDERDLTELTARMLRAFSVSSIRGYAAPEVQEDHRRAEVLAARLGERPEVLPSLIAIWSYWFAGGALATSGAIVDRLTTMVERDAYTWFEPEVEAVAGWQHFYEGQVDHARAHLRRAVSGFAARPAEQKVSPFWPLPNDPVAVSDIALACLAALRGESEDMQRWADSAIARSEEIGFPRGPFSLAFVKAYLAWLYRWLGDHPTSWRLGAEVVQIGQEYGYAFWMILGSSYTATADPASGPQAAFLEQNIATLRLMGQEAFAASNLAYLAHLRAEEGDLDAAVAVLGEALEVVYKTGEEIHLPELLRIRAHYEKERGGDLEEALADLAEAVHVATRQGSRVARLRAAVDLARLPDPHRPEDWRDTLAAARSALPPSYTSDDTAVADSLLAG